MKRLAAPAGTAACTQERIAAFRETIADVREGRFPERGHLVDMEAPFLDEVMRSIGGGPSSKQS